MKKFGLIFHMFFTSEIDKRGMASQLTPCGFQLSDDFVHETLQRGEIIAFENTMEVRSGSNTILGRDWVIPMTPAEILRDQEKAIQMTVKACEMAQSWGVEIIGLGLMLGKIGRRGEEVRRQIGVPVTNGDAFLVFNSVQILKDVIQSLKLDLAEQTIAIFGLPNLIGQNLAAYLITLGVNVVLVAKSTPFIERLRRNLAHQHGRIPQIVPSIQQAQETCKFFLTSGSEDQVIAVHDFVYPAIVIDVSFPRNVPEASDHVLILDAGLVDVPKDFLHFTGYHPNRAMACLSELMMLSLEGYTEDFSIGRRISIPEIRKIGACASKYGFKSRQLYSFSLPIDSNQIVKFYHNHFPNRRD